MAAGRKKDPPFVGINYDIIHNMDIYTLDLDHQHVPQTIAAYLVVGPAGPLLIETGPGATLPRLKVQLAVHGYAPEDIRHVLVTHIHFDHAGAAGWWAQQGAQVYVHHVGAPHLIDPSRLVSSATRIYGDQMGTLWGDMLPAPAAKVTALHDGTVITAAGLTISAHDTPGHASHHHVFQLGRVAFVGDIGGIRLPDTSFVALPAPPPEFNLETWLHSIEKVRALGLDAVYPTHFGRVTHVSDHFQALTELLYDSVKFVQERVDAGMSRDGLVAEYLQWNRVRARQSGVSDDKIFQYETANPLYMSVDGIMRYLRKRSA